MSNIKGTLKINVLKRRSLKKDLFFFTITWMIILSLIFISTTKNFAYHGSEEIDVPEVRIIEPQETEEVEEEPEVTETSVRLPERVETDVDTLSEEDTYLDTTVEESDNTSNDVVETEEPVEEEPECEIIEEPEPRYQITDEEYDILSRVVEAEVEGYDVWIQKGLSHEEIINAKTRVAQVFLNRVENESFKHRTLKDALLYPNATSTLKDGRYYKVKVTEYTTEAVDLALSPYTPDLTQGALYFSSGSGRSYGDTQLFTDAVGHKFSR